MKLSNTSLALVLGLPITLFAPSAFAQTGEPEGTKAPPATGTTPTTEEKPGPLTPPPAAEIKQPSTVPYTVAPEVLPPQVAGEKAGKLGGDFMDTRLTWTFGDDDILHRTGTTQPSSPLPTIGDNNRYRLFFDSLNSRYSGRENLTHLVLYRKMPGFITNLDTEAALVLRFDMQELAANNQNVNRALFDAGSYIRLFYKTGPKKEGIGLTFFPLDTDRFRLGYLYDISWGGTNASRNESIFPRLVGSSPGLKVQYDGPSGFYVFGGFKTAQIVQPQTNLTPGSTAGNDVEVVRVQETNYGFLGGLGADFTENVHADAGAGYFQQGRFEFPDLRPPPDTDRQAPRVFTYGASGRFVLHHGMAAPSSVDFQLYRNDPNAPMLIFAPEKYSPHEVAYSIAVEGTQLEQNLHDPDPNKTGATKLQAARAAALSGIVKVGYTRLSLAAIYRDLPYVLRNVPSLVPFEAIDAHGTKTQTETFFAGSVDYYIPDLHLRPGIGGGIQLPATFTAESTVGNAPADRTVVVRRQGDVSILPTGSKRKPVFQGRVSLRWDLSDILAAVGWVQIINDPNGTLVTRDPTEGSVPLRTFQASTLLGFGVTLQARY